jgi:hypothetical protein
MYINNRIQIFGWNVDSSNGHLQDVDGAAAGRVARDDPEEVLRLEGRVRQELADLGSMLWIGFSLNLWIRLYKLNFKFAFWLLEPLNQRFNVHNNQWNFIFDA